MKPFKLLLFLLLLLVGNNQFTYSQTFGNGNLGTVFISNANQTVNDYYGVNSINGSTIGLNSFLNFSSQRVLIIQMEGPSAGTWEWARISFSNGNSVDLLQPLTRTYSISDKVQLIIVPEYEYLNLTSFGSLTCPPYNPITGTGGVLAFNVKEIFSIEDNATCNVTGKGYPGGFNGFGGSAGTGGTGGLAGVTVGQDGGNNGIQPNTGIFNGGNGGSYGNPGTNGSVAGGLVGIGSGSNASNLSLLQANPTTILLGGAGSGGNGGDGKAGAGGGGGAGVGAQNGTNGADGTFGGDGGNGGNGGGIILFAAKDLVINNPSPVFIAEGTNGSAATNGSDAGNGGNGGVGVNCFNACGGGGGRGGDGGNGGNGGSGGAGGSVYGIIAPSSTIQPLTANLVSLNGGFGANGGLGGDNGIGGQNAWTISGPCVFPAPPTVPIGVCSLEGTLLILEQMGITGTNNASYTLTNGVHRWATPNGTYYVEMIDLFPGQNLGFWRIFGVGAAGPFFANIQGDPNFDLYQALDNLVNQSNIVTYTSTANSQIGEIFNGLELFTSQCEYIRLTPADGIAGTNGSPGQNANPGQFGSGSPDCDPANLVYAVNPGANGNDDIVVDFQGFTFIGSYVIDGAPTQITESNQIVIPVFANITYVNLQGEIFDNCGNSIEVNWTIDFPPSTCTVDLQYSIQNATCSNPNTVVTIDGFINTSNNIYYGITTTWSDNGINDIESGDFSSYFQVIRTLSPGTYEFQALDYNNCLGVLNFTIDEPEAVMLNLNTTISQPSCSNPLGTIQANASLGTAPYTYILNGGTTSATGVFTGLNPGNYSIEAIDANGCSTVNSNLTITNSTGSSLAINLASTQATCTNPFGAITAQTTGGVDPFSYSLNGQSPTNNPNFTNLPAGVYSVVVTDANGCSATSSTVSILGITNNLAVTFTTIQPLCSSAGSIEANVTGGTAPFTFTINGQSNSNSSFNNLTQGNYTINVTDANGCSTNGTVTINAPINLNATATLIQAICPGDGGTISVQVSGGTAPYLYNFGQGQTSASSYTTLPGTYNVQITDANNCTTQISNLVLNDWITFDVDVITTIDYCNSSNGTATVNVNIPTGVSSIQWLDGNQSFIRTNLAAGYYEALITSEDNCTSHIDVNVEADKYPVEFTASISEITCFNGTNGSIELTFTNGIAPYTVDWGFTTGTLLTNLAAGTYTATISDGNGCENSAQYTLVNPAPLSLVGNVTNSSCFGACNGSIQLVSPTNYNIVSYNWSPSSNPTAMNQSNLCAGNYQVTATTDLGCLVSESFLVKEPSEINISIISTQNNPCFGDKVAFIKVQVTGGVAPYTYAWSNGGTTQTISNLQNGTYNLVVTDANGCIQTFQHTITSPPQLNLIISGNTSYCAGSSATITVSGSGGSAPYFGAGTYTYLAGTYQLSIKDKNGCKVTQDITIIELPIPKFEITSTPTCKEQSNGTASLTELNAVHPVTYLWSNGQTTQSISNLGPGIYTVTVTDANGCTNNYSTNVLNTSPPVISAAITNAGCAPSTNGGIVLTVNQIANNQNVSYIWNTSATTSQLTNIGSGTYTVNVTDENGCNVQSSFEVINDCGCPLNFNVDICGPTVVCQGENFTLNTNIFPRPQGYPYTYTWTTPLGTSFTSPNLTVTGAALTASGWYTLTVNLPPNCTFTTQVFVTVRPRPIATISNAVTGTVDNYMHMKGCDIDLTATGGVYYNWFITSSPVLNNHTNQLTQPTNSSTASTVFFKVTAIDSFGCASQQVQHRVRTANPVVTRSINNTGTSQTIIRTLTMNQTTQFANATYTWSSNGWNPASSSVALRQRTGTISQLAGVYTLEVDQNGCKRYFQFELSKNATFTPTIELGTNKMYFNEEIETIESEDLFQIKAFPNPVTDELKFEFENPNNEDIGLIILDNNGRILTDLNVGTDQKNVTIDVSSFATGMYFVQCTRDSIIHREKIKIIKE